MLTMVCRDLDASRGYYAYEPLQDRGRAYLECRRCSDIQHLHETLSFAIYVWGEDLQLGLKDIVSSMAFPLGR